MENQKKLINLNIEKEELLSYSKKVVLKSLKTIYSNQYKNYKKALEILENKDKDTLEDLTQEVATNIFLNNYIIKKDAFLCVARYLYNLNKSIKNDTLELENENINMDNEYYKNYLIDNNKIDNTKYKINFKMLDLTEKQKQIVDLYNNNLTISQIAEELNISSKGTVSNTIKRIINKINSNKDLYLIKL